jgi:hypothetical protein
MSGQIVVPTPGSVLQGPIFSDFEPQINLIQSVTNAENAIVTTITPHGYQDGIYVRVIVPVTYGMNIYEETQILVTSSTSFSTSINTLNLDPFVAPTLYPPVGFTPAQTIPMGGTTDNIA